LTVPVGLVDPGTLGVMVAVKVTAWLTTEGETDAATVVVVVGAPTLMEAVVPELDEKFVSPDVYNALMMYVPAVGSETPAPEHTAVVTPAVVLTGTDAHCVSGTEDPPLSV
jgi:hypothetical protein